MRTRLRALAVTCVAAGVAIAAVIALPLVQHWWGHDGYACYRKLGHLSIIIENYAASHNGSLPDNAWLASAEPASSFVCPGASHRCWFFRSVPVDGPGMRLGDYVYVGPSADTDVLMYESVDNHAGLRCNVLLRDGGILWLTSSQLRDRLHKKPEHGTRIDRDRIRAGKQDGDR